MKIASEEESLYTQYLTCLELHGTCLCKEFVIACLQENMLKEAAMSSNKEVGLSSHIHWARVTNAFFEKHTQKNTREISHAFLNTCKYALETPRFKIFCK